MNVARIAGIVLVIAGVVSLAWGSFSYTKESHRASIGPVELVAKDRDTVLVPVWLSIAAIVVGGVSRARRHRQALVALPAPDSDAPAGSAEPLACSGSLPRLAGVPTNVCQLLDEPLPRSWPPR